VTATTTGSRRLGLSLETRIFLVTSLLILLSVGAAVVLTFFLIRGIARNAALESLRSSASAQSAFEEQRYQQLKLISRLFVNDPYLTAYVAQAAGEMDTASILDLLAERQSDLGYDFAVVLDPAGRVVARTDRPQAVGQDLSRQPLIAKALADFEGAGVWREGDQLYYAAVVPLAKDFTLLGYMVAGFAIDERSVRAVQEISGADVAIVVDGDAGPEVMVSTLAPAVATGLTAALRSREQERMGNAMRAGEAVQETELSLRGEPWLASLAPIQDESGKSPGATIALASLARELAAYREIQNVLLGAGLAAVLLTPILAFVITRRTLRPVRRLVTAAEAARQGDYDQQIDSDRTDEIGRLAHAFSELLADLREKRDMEAYVAELSRNLPEPAQARAPIGEPQSREVLLLAVELRGLARTEGDPQGTLDRVGADLKRVTEAVSRRRGRIETVSGHRVLARFEGEGRGTRALAAAAQILEASPPGPDGSDTALANEAEAPVVAMAAGRTVSGPVVYGEQAERALVGFPVQQLESLLREATPGELLLSREVHEELRETFEGAGFRLAPRRGVISPQPLYVVSPQMASRVTGVRGIGATPPAETLAPALLSTLSGIAPGALMGQRFEILSVLGSGGMGVVYKARDRELDDLVALKMLKRDLWGDRGQLERLKSELKLARKITHPNVLRTHDFGEIDGVPYISMEYVRGVTLRYMLDQSQRLPYSAGLRLAKQLCTGLGAAHAVGVLHRDIKPENLILESNGNAKLMDFGIARPVTRLAPGQTQAGFIVGTPQYLAPEVIQGKEADIRADVYSCGMVLYEIFTGVLPFNGPTAMEIVLKHIREEPARPSAHWPEIPPRLEAAILRCLAKDPDQRYRSTEELLRDLEALSA
jgi:serine/threonine-protein kinase